MPEMERNIVTVLTPSYNRAPQLKALWHSLCSQGNQRFEWLVVDDGSQDDTEKTVKDLSEQSNFPVVYVKKENGGKHTALNVGINKVQTPLSFIVDSDDILTDDAIETIIKYYERFRDESDVCGFSFLRMFPDGKINGKLFPHEDWKAGYIQTRINADDMMSDKAEVYKTSCLKEFPFPEFDGERFLGEDVVWIRMGRKYKTIHVNKAIYIGDYQTDGLTVNRRRHNLQAPNGCTVRAREYLQKDICVKARMKATLQYLIYGRVAGMKYRQLYEQAPNTFWCLLLTLPAWLIRMHWMDKER